MASLGVTTGVTIAGMIGEIAAVVANQHHQTYRRRNLEEKEQIDMSQEVYDRQTTEISERGKGGALFAGALLLIGGSLWLVEGITGVFRGTVYVETTNNLITTSAATWGWIHIIGALISLVAGYGIFNAAGWARWLGIVIASLSILVNFVFVAMAPFWALTIIAIDLWIIHSLFVYRRSPH
jgi:hypothetical protein